MIAVNLKMVGFAAGVLAGTGWGSPAGAGGSANRVKQTTGAAASFDSQRPRIVASPVQPWIVSEESTRFQVMPRFLRTGILAFDVRVTITFS